VARTRIKFCGITRSEDLASAVQAGADAIGLVFHAPSSRAVSLEQARKLLGRKPAWVSVVGLFVDADAERVARVAKALKLDCLQFHGSETPEYCAQFGVPWMKALPVAPGSDIGALAGRYEGASALLLDTWKAGVAGGTGEVFDWRLVPGTLPAPLVLAGGLDAGNVEAAIRSVRPYAVDVSGGIETSPGHKCFQRMQAFASAVRTTDAALESEAGQQMAATR